MYLQVEEHKSIYQRYMKLVCDAIAMSGLTIITKEAIATLEKCQSVFATMVPEEKRRTPSDLFSYLMLRPLQRIHEYENFLQTDSLTFPSLKYALTHKYSN